MLLHGVVPHEVVAISTKVPKQHEAGNACCKFFLLRTEGGFDVNANLIPQVMLASLDSPSLVSHVELGHSCYESITLARLPHALTNAPRPFVPVPAQELVDPVPRSPNDALPAE
eukprot:958432-Pleurochrysis_carterae.AAC.7